MKEVVDFSRIDLFEHYNNMDNPFIIMTIPIDVTNVVNYAKVHRHFYATLGFLVGKAVNEVDGFKYRYIDNKIYYCDKVSPNFTEKVGEQIGFFDCDSSNLEDFIKEFDEQKSKLGNYDESQDNRQDVIWISCFPWAKFSGLMSPHDRSITIPQFIWDKYEEVNGRYYCNMMIMVHHGFADGYHVGNFIEKLNKLLEDLSI